MLEKTILTLLALAGPAPCHAAPPPEPPVKRLLPTAGADWRLAQNTGCHYRLRRVCTWQRVRNRYGGWTLQRRCYNVRVRVCGRHRN